MMPCRIAYDTYADLRLFCGANILGTNSLRSGPIRSQGAHQGCPLGPGPLVGGPLLPDPLGPWGQLCVPKIQGVHAIRHGPIYVYIYIYLSMYMHMYAYI